MIAGVPDWRGITLVILVALSLGFVSVPFADPPEGPTEITGEVRSNLTHSALVTISVDGVSETVWVPSPSLASPDRRDPWVQLPFVQPNGPAVVEYSIPLDTGGEYTVEVESIRTPRSYHRRALSEHYVRALANLNGTRTTPADPYRRSLLELSAPHRSADEHYMGIPGDEQRRVKYGGRLIGQPSARNYSVTVNTGETVENVDFLIVQRPLEWEWSNVSPERREHTPPSPPGDHEGWGVNIEFPRWMLTVLVLASLLGLLVIQFVLARTGAEIPAGEAGEDEETDAAAIGRLAGRAADRLAGDSPFENEVYRAWYEMTRALEVTNPASASPGEFQAAAIDAGLPAEPVADLTELFTAVRYGGADPDVHTEAAIETLRAIEAAGTTHQEESR